MATPTPRIKIKGDIKRRYDWRCRDKECGWRCGWIISQRLGEWDRVVIEMRCPKCGGGVKFRESSREGAMGVDVGVGVKGRSLREVGMGRGI